LTSSVFQSIFGVWLTICFVVQERKKAVKAEAKERRKHKMPKADKKRAVKKGK
jgi:hypothetical protein